MGREGGGAAEGGVLAILAFAVLAFGGTSYWARATLQVGVAILFAVWWVGAARRQVPAAFAPSSQAGGWRLAGLRLRGSGLEKFALAVGALGLLQLVPLPPPVREWLSPTAEQLELPLEAVLSGNAAGAAAWRPASLDPSGTVGALLQLLTCGLLFVLVYNLADSRARLVRLCRMVVALAAVVAFAALVQDLSGTERIYGLRALRYGGSPYGPFVNHNHFAGYMELTIPLTFALMLRQLLRPAAPRPAPGPGDLVGPGSAARRMLHDGSEPRRERAGQVILLGIVLALMGAALLLSLSRGGVVSLTVASAAVLVALAIGGSLGRWEVAALSVVAAAGIALFLWAGPGETLDHFRRAESLQNEPSFLNRWEVWEATLQMARDFPGLGIGLGAFPLVFRHYYPAGTERIWLQAHNDYVQLLAEVGLAGGLVAALGLAWLVLRLVGPLLRRPAVREHFLYQGLVTGIVALLVHSAVDFNLQIPANALQFTVLVALALAHRDLLRREAPAEA